MPLDAFGEAVGRALEHVLEAQCYSLPACCEQVLSKSWKKVFHEVSCPVRTFLCL